MGLKAFNHQVMQLARTRVVLSPVMRTVTVVAIITAMLFFVAPDDVGGDFELFRIVSLKALAAEPLYTDIVSRDSLTVRYLYLPHVAFLLVPLAILPLRVGWAILCGFTILAVTLVGRRWNFDLLKVILSLTAVPAMYCLYQGNIDGALMITLLLPVPWQIVAILAKPQSIGGLAIRSLRHKQAWMVLVVILFVALIFHYGDSFVFAQQARGLSMNLWHKVFPFQLVVGATMLFIGLLRHDERIMLMGSPFLSPYITLGSIWPAWVGLCALTNRWVMLLLWACFWLATGWGLLRQLM